MKIFLQIESREFPKRKEEGRVRKRKLRISRRKTSTSNGSRLGMRSEGIMTQMGNLCYFSSYFMFIGIEHAAKKDQNIFICLRRRRLIKVKFWRILRKIDWNARIFSLELNSFCAKATLRISQLQFLSRIDDEEDFGILKCMEFIKVKCFFCQRIKGACSKTE